MLQGEREFANDNKSVGRFILDGIAPAPRGVPQIEVTFNIDANGILNVSAKDKGTGKEQSITIQNSGNLSKEDIAKAQAEAEAHAEEDKQKRETTDARNTLESMIYQAKKMPDEFKDKITEDDKKALTEAAAEAEKHLKAESKDELESATKELSEKMQSIGAKLYQAAAESAKQSGDQKPSESGGADDDTVEGEVVDKK